MRAKRTVVDRSLQAILRTLGDIGHTLESLSEPEQRIRHSLQFIRRIIPYDGCALLEVRSERAAVDTFGHAWQERPVQLSLPDLPPVMADRRRIHQVVSNLLSNAVKASPSREPVVVTVTAEGDRAVVRVRDFGRGIPRDKLPLLFQKFSQVHESGGRGTGLGLVISKGIVAAHGGSIWAESDGEGRGATFSFTLPIVLPQDAQAG